MPQRRRHERGAAAVEFALVLPILVLFVIGGIVDFGRAVHGPGILTNAAREGTRYATVVVKDATTATTYKNAIESRAKAAAGLDPTAQLALTSTFTFNCTGPATGTMQVTVTHPQFNWLFLNVLPGLNNPQPLIGKSVIGCP